MDGLHVLRVSSSLIERDESETWCGEKWDGDCAYGGVEHAIDAATVGDDSEICGKCAEKISTAIVARSQASSGTDNHAHDAERMQGIRERAERYANGGHRFEPRDVIYVLCELDAERQRADALDKRNIELWEQVKAADHTKEIYRDRLSSALRERDAARQRADAAEHAANEMSARWNSILNAKKAAEKLIEQYKQNVAEHLHCKMEEIEKHPCPHIGQRDRRIAELEAAARLQCEYWDSLHHHGVVIERAETARKALYAALSRAPDGAPVMSKSVAKRHAIMREAREDATNLADPGNNLVDESPTMPWIDPACGCERSPDVDRGTPCPEHAAGPMAHKCYETLGVCPKCAPAIPATENDGGCPGPWNASCNASPTTSAKLNGTVEDCDPRQVDRNVSLDTRKEKP